MYNISVIILPTISINSLFANSFFPTLVNLALLPNTSNSTLASLTSTKQLVVGKRALNATSGQFTPIAGVQQWTEGDRIRVSSLSQLDGEYVVLVENVAQ